MPAPLLTRARCFTFDILNIFFKTSYYQLLILTFKPHLTQKERNCAFSPLVEHFAQHTKIKLKTIKFNYL